MPKEERQIKEITDNDLDTGRDLVTENYELEILTLKDKVDLRRFSRAFLKVDKLLKNIFTGKEDKFSKNSGFNKEKTDLVENDTNKLLSAKGLFDYNQEKELIKFKINAKAIGNTVTSIDLNSIVDNGFYVSTSSANLFTNTPNSNTAFELTVTGLTDSRLGYKTQLIKSIGDNKYFVRTNKHWSDNSWTPWQQLAFDDEVYKRCRFLDNGLPTAESILNLEPGIYNVAATPIFELPTGYYTVQRLNNKTESGDNTVIVYKAGSGEKFYITSFNSNRWTGWKEFNHCPYNVGDFYLTSNTRNPSLIWHGTSWELIEGRMLIGAKSGQFNLGTTGGNQNINLSLGQLPRHRLQVDSFNLGRGTMNITGSLGNPTTEGGNYGNGAFTASYSSGGRSAGSGGGSVSFSFDASKAWTGTTTSASPYTNYIGNGEAINIMNPYLAINIWKRIG